MTPRRPAAQWDAWYEAVVDLAVLDQADQLRQRPTGQAEPDLGVDREERLKHRRQPVEGAGRERHAPPLQPPHVAQFGGRVVQLLEDPIDVPEERGPVLRQAQASPPAIEQGDAELTFQAGDGSAQRWLGHVQRFGRSGHVLELGDHPEVRELQQFHRLFLTDDRCLSGYRMM